MAESECLALGYGSVDPVTLALNSATALTAALTLLFSRLDAHRHSEEHFNLQTALENLWFALVHWRANAEATNRIVQSWMQGNQTIDDVSSAVEYIFKDQLTSMDGAFNLLNLHTPRGAPLREVLGLYGPEVLDALEAGMGQRRQLLDTLVAELPHLKAEEPQALDAMMTQLESTSRELDDASTRLREYIRNNFPISKLLG